MASARLGISQPSLSNAINHLEDELGGVRLFEKVGRNIRLTEEGRYYQERVDAARQRQHDRFGANTTMCNARMGPDEMRKFCTLDEASAELMKQAFDALGLTARSYDRILKVARTIADLSGAENVEVEHIAEAIQYRNFDRTGY